MEFKKIDGFTNYKISSNGKICNIKTNKELKQYCNKSYMGVYLYENKKRKYKLVHRLVAQAFIPNPNNYPQINHKDENPKNNSVDNLEWCTAKYNSNYGNHKDNISKIMKENNPFKGKKHTLESKEKMRKAKLGKSSKRKRPVIINNIKYESITDAMKKLNIGTKKIYKILKEREIKND